MLVSASLWVNAKTLALPYFGVDLSCSGNPKQNAQVSHNYSNSNSLWSDDQVCHNSDSSDSFGQYDQLSHNYSILRCHYSRLDVVSYTCNIMATAQNFVELVYLPQAVLVYLDFMAHSSSYLLSKASHRIHQACFRYWATLPGT